MTRDQILERIRRVARERLEVFTWFELDTHLLRDLQLDSLKQLSFVVELENEFEICFEPEDEDALETMANVVDLVERRLGAGREGMDG
jgi:acyl carrier protein